MRTASSYSYGSRQYRLGSAFGQTISKIMKRDSPAALAILDALPLREKEQRTHPTACSRASERTLYVPSHCAVHQRLHHIYAATLRHGRQLARIPLVTPQILLAFRMGCDEIDYTAGWTLSADHFGIKRGTTLHTQNSKSAISADARMDPADYPPRLSNSSDSRLPERAFRNSISSIRSTRFRRCRASSGRRRNSTPN